ncbi:MAG: DUF58 domain-containing protein [Planctomycetota bacterium]
MEDYRRYLDPKTLNKVAGLELKARLIVEGFVAGRHQSPLKGSSVEFREHREYVPGDDTRFLDWKVYAKTDRFYIKEYEEETSLKAYMVVDTSHSMSFASGDNVSKLEYAKFVAASLTHLISQQQDAAALVLWDHELKKFLPPGNNPLHIRDIYRSLSEVKAQGKTDIGALLADVAERLRQRSLIILLSDLFDDDGGLDRGLKYVRHKGHDVICFHTLDPAELTFPFDRMTRFEGLEVEDRLLADPKALKEAYLEELEAFIQNARSACMANKMDYVQLDTSAPLDIALSSYLAARAGAH